MIKSFKNKKLKKFFLNQDPSGLKPEHLRKISRILAIMNISDNLLNLKAIPSYRLHQLKGELKNYWAVSVSGNYRITFKFEDNCFIDVDYIDYH